MTRTKQTRSTTKWLLLFFMLFLSIPFIPFPESESLISENNRVTMGQLMVSNSNAVGASQTSFAKKALAAAGALLVLLFRLVKPERAIDRPRVCLSYAYPAISLRLKRLYLIPLKFTSNFVS
ncbi:hypothetical protein [Cohnella algarum]|uniref:hypothetical protein n=1 Tax=Cohnella algarum TaxID=2044859 RepID=UPI001968792C|nr:hypothetical protein [Cohnella algarum]MBN2980319.1 hypothetical protein [Cohnella algarum]